MIFQKIIFHAYESITNRNMSKGFQEILYYANDVTQSWLSNLILIGIYIITLMGIYNSKRDLIMGISIAGFFTSIIASLFWIADFINGITLVFIIGVALFGFILIFIGHRNLG